MTTLARNSNVVVCCQNDGVCDMAYFLVCAIPADLWTPWQSTDRPPAEDDLFRQLLSDVQALTRRINNRVNLENERSRYLCCTAQIEAILLRRITEATTAARICPRYCRIGGEYFDFLAYVLRGGTLAGGTKDGSRPVTAGATVTAGPAAFPNDTCFQVVPASLGTSIFPPGDLASLFDEVKRYLDRKRDWPEPIRRVVECRQRFIRRAIGARCGLVEIQQVLDNELPRTAIAVPLQPIAASATISSSTPAPVPIVKEPLTASRRMQMVYRLQNDITEALTSGSTVNMSNQPHEVSTEVLSQFVRKLSDSDPDCLIRIIYADGSEARPFPVRVLPVKSPTGNSDVTLKVALMSMRHLQLDKLVDFAWYRNVEVSQARALAESDDFCFEYSLQQLRLLASAFKGRHVTISMYHTGFEPASVGFYRALTAALMKSCQYGVDWTPATPWIRVLPHYLRPGDRFDVSIHEWGFHVLGKQANAADRGAASSGARRATKRSSRMKTGNR